MNQLNSKKHSGTVASRKSSRYEFYIRKIRTTTKQRYTEVSFDSTKIL